MHHLVVSPDCLLTFPIRRAFETGITVLVSFSGPSPWNEASATPGTTTLPATGTKTFITIANLRTTTLGTHSRRNTMPLRKGCEAAGMTRPSRKQRPLGVTAKSTISRRSLGSRTPPAFARCRTSNPGKCTSSTAIKRGARPPLTTSASEEVTNESLITKTVFRIQCSIHGENFSTSGTEADARDHRVPGGTELGEDVRTSTQPCSRVHTTAGHRPRTTGSESQRGGPTWTPASNTVPDRCLSGATAPQAKKSRGDRISADKPFARVRTRSKVTGARRSRLPVRTRFLLTPTTNRTPPAQRSSHRPYFSSSPGKWRWQDNGRSLTNPSYRSPTIRGTRRKNDSPFSTRITRFNFLCKLREFALYFRYFSTGLQRTKCI